MNPHPLYVAGPYSAPTPDALATNVARALALGRLGVHRGRAPLVPHLLGAAGLYGAPDESDPECRSRAIRCSRALARMVGEARGELWVIERDDGTLSEGTMEELEAFVQGIRDWDVAGALVTRARWDVWAGWMAAEGLPVEVR